MDGVSDAVAVRGVLTAAAEPQPGVPVWRQGAGVLREAPTAGLAGRRPLVVEGLHLTAFNFYIHDLPAEDQTFALLPALPPAPVCSPARSSSCPSTPSTSPPQTDPKRLFGAATGQTGLKFPLHPGGADQGTLTFAYVPLEPARPAAVHVGDLSFELTTWQRVDWPPAELPREGRMAPGVGGAPLVHGHAFAFDSNYRAVQMDHPACRRVADGEVAADVCENWQVLVHSPVDDAETFELVDRDSGQGFLVGVRTAGGGFHHPHRGVHGKREDFEVGGVTLPLGRGVVTNGRFWEQLVVPTQALAAHPGGVEVRLEDNLPGGRSTLLGHADGPVPLAPYVAFAPWHRRVGPGLLDDLSALVG